MKPKALQAIAKSSIVTLRIVKEGKDDVFLQSLSRDGVFPLLQDLRAFPNLKTVQLNLNLYDNLWERTVPQVHSVLMAAKKSCPKLGRF